MVAIAVTDTGERAEYARRFREQYPRAMWGDIHFNRRLRERSITPTMVDQAVLGEPAVVFERYPGEDCYALLGYCWSGQPLHVKMRFGNPPELVTVYDPSTDHKDRWESDLVTRRRAP